MVHLAPSQSRPPSHPDHPEPPAPPPRSTLKGYSSAGRTSMTHTWLGPGRRLHSSSSATESRGSRSWRSSASGSGGPSSRPAPRCSAGGACSRCSTERGVIAFTRRDSATTASMLMSAAEGVSDGYGQSTAELVVRDSDRRWP